MMELLKIRTDQFEGPLDLLLFLIQKNELDISAISIHKITDQYVQYCELIKELNFDGASEFLLMASTLIYLKSKKLLPVEQVTTNQANSEGEIQTEEDLIRRLIEYKKYQEAGQRISELPMLGKDVFTRPNVPPPDKQMVWREMDLSELTIVFQDVLKRSRKRTKIIIREPTSIPERIAQLAKILKVNEMTEFNNLFSAEPDKPEVVVTFIALLELARLKRVRFFQNTSFATIYITLTESIDSIDQNLMTGFQYNSGKLHDYISATAQNPQKAEPTTTSNPG